MAQMTIPLAIQIFAAVSAAVSLAISLSSMGKVGDFGASDLGTAINRKGKDDPRIIPLGRSIIPATKVFSNVNNHDQKWVMQVLSLGHGPLKSIQQVYIDGQSMFGTTLVDRSEQWFTGNSLETGFENCQIGIRRGTAISSTWNQIITNSDGMWTTAHRGDGIASISLLVERPDLKGKTDNPYRILSDRIAVTALCEGIAHIDPRTDPLLLGWKDKSKRTHTSFRNPITALLTYLLDDEFGFRLDPSMIDLNAFISTANWCDANNIFLDGFIDQSDTFGNILNKFSSAFGGNIYLEEGRIKVSPESASPVLFNIKEDDLIGDMSLTNNKGDYFNTIKIDFQNKDTTYDKDSFVLPKDATADARIREDGRIFDKSMDCPLSTEPNYIKSIANRELKRSLLCRKEVTFTVNNMQHKLRMGNVFTLTNTLYQLDTSTKWRVTKLESSLDETVLQTKVSAVQYDERIYDTTSYDDGNLSSSLPKPNFSILPVTGLQFVQNATLSVGSGILNFESQYKGDARFRIQYKLSTSTDWEQYGEYPFENVQIVGLQAGVNYDFRVQCFSVIGASAWTTISNVRVNRSIALPAVTGLVADFTGPNCVIKFNPISKAITNTTVQGDGLTNLSQLVHYYEVSVKHGTAAAKSYRTSTPQFTYTFAENSKNGLSRSLSITVKAISIYGDSSAASTITATNAPMGQPSGVTVESILVTLGVKFDNPTDLDFSHSNIYLTATQQAIPTATDKIGETSSGFWTTVKDYQRGWIRVENVDVFGSQQPSIVTSAPIYFEMQGIDDLISGSEFESNFNELDAAMKLVEAEVTKANQDISKAKTDITNSQADIVKAQDEVTKARADITKAQADIATVAGDLMSIDTEISDKVAAQQLEIDKAKTDILSNATSISTVTDSVTDQGLEIATVKTLATSTDGKLATLDTRLTSAVGTNTAGIATNKTSIATTNKALSDYKLVVTSEFGKTNGNVTNLTSSLSTLEGTVATQGTTITANNTTLDNKIKATNATVATQGTAIANADKALSELKTSTAANFADTNSKVDTTTTNLATTDTALAALDTRLTAKTNTNASGIATNKTSIATTTKALADYKLVVTSEFGKTNGNVTNLSTSLSTLEGTVATQGTTITANNTALDNKIKATNATVATQGTAIADNTKALSDYKLVVTSEFDKTNGSITDLTTSLSTLEGTVATQGTTITSNNTALDNKIKATNATVATQGTTIAANTKALADYKLVVTSEFGKTNGNVTNLTTSLSTLEGTVATQGTTISANNTALDNKIKATNATVATQGTAIANTDKALTEFKTSTAANFADTNSKADTAVTNSASATAAVAALDTKLSASVAANTAGVASNKSAIATQTSALSTYKTSNDAAVNGVKASVSTVSSAQATTAGTVNAMYGLKVDANGKVAGFTLAATSKGTTVDFLADTFRIASTTAAGAATVFEVRGGKVMIKSLYVGDITASQITAGAITGREINAASVITAGSGNSSVTMNGAHPTWGLYSGNANPDAAPFRVNKAGALFATGANITGNIVATSGSFNGTITAQGGSFASAIYCGSNNSAYISGHPQHHFLQGPNGNFVVDRNGNLFANSGDFKGTIYAEKIVGDIVNAGVTPLPAFNAFAIQSGQVYELFSMSFPSAPFSRVANLVKFPVVWRGAENGGTYSMYLRDSTGRNTWLFSGGGITTFAISELLENLYVKIPAGCTWWKIVLTADRRSSLSRAAADQSGWSLFKEGSGGVSVAHP